jgi:hypothetical protein
MDDEIKEGGTGRAYSAHRGGEKTLKILLSGNLNGRDYLGYLAAGGRIILKWILGKYRVRWFG